MKFLIVDDNRDILHLLSTIVEFFGHGVDEAADGLEAMEHLQNNQYDVVITDANMPRTDGAKLCGHLKSQFPHTFVIGISGSVAGLKGLEDAGADICLSKPFGMESLEEAILKHVCSSAPRLACPQPVA